MKRLKFTARAESDLRSIIEYFDPLNPAAGEKIIAQIGESLERLARLPHLGRATVRDGVRCLVVPALPYKIFYTTMPAQVVVLSIFHTSRNPGKEP